MWFSGGCLSSQRGKEKREVGKRDGGNHPEAEKQDTENQHTDRQGWRKRGIADILPVGYKSPSTPGGVSEFLSAPRRYYLGEGDYMSDNIIEFPNSRMITDEDALDPNEMLQNICEDVEMIEALVVGWTKEGKLFMGTSHGKAPDMVFLLELAKSVLLNKCVGDDDV